MPEVLRRCISKMLESLGSPFKKSDGTNLSVLLFFYRLKKKVRSFQRRTNEERDPSTVISTVADLFV
jgi:hypothetical protein